VELYIRIIVEFNLASICCHALFYKVRV